MDARNRTIVDEFPSDPVFSYCPFYFNDDDSLNNLFETSRASPTCFPDVLTKPSDMICDDEIFGFNVITCDPFGLGEEFNVIAENSSLVPINPILSHEDTEKAEPDYENLGNDQSELSGIEPPLKLPRISIPFVEQSSDPENGSYPYLEDPDNLENGSYFYLEDPDNPGPSNKQLDFKENLFTNEAVETVTESIGLDPLSKYVREVIEPFEFADSEQLVPTNGLSEDNAEETFKRSSEENNEGHNNQEEVDYSQPDTERPPSSTDEESTLSDIDKQPKGSGDKDSQSEKSHEKPTSVLLKESLEKLEELKKIVEKQSGIAVVRRILGEVDKSVKKEISSVVDDAPENEISSAVDDAPENEISSAVDDAPENEISSAVDNPPENLPGCSSKMATAMSGNSLLDSSNFEEWKSSLSHLINFDDDSDEGKNEKPKVKEISETTEENDDDDDPTLEKKFNSTMATLDKIAVHEKLIKEELDDHKQFIERQERAEAKAIKDFGYKDEKLKEALWDHHCKNIKILTTNQLIEKLAEANLWDELTAINKGEISSFWHKVFHKGASITHMVSISISEPFSFHFQNVLTDQIRKRMYEEDIDVSGRVGHYITAVLVPEGMLRVFAYVNDIPVEYAMLQLVKRYKYHSSLPDAIKTKAIRLLAKGGLEGVLHNEQGLYEASASSDYNIFEIEPSVKLKKLEKMRKMEKKRKMEKIKKMEKMKKTTKLKKMKKMKKPPPLFI